MEIKNHLGRPRNRGDTHQKKHARKLPLRKQNKKYNLQTHSK